MHGVNIDIFSILTGAELGQIATTSEPHEVFVPGAGNYVYAEQSNRLEIFPLNGAP